VKVAISSINKAAASGLDPRVKSINYLANIFAKAEGEARGCYEAILLGPRGEIAELSTSSFFCVFKENGRDVAVTPPIGAEGTGILPGITRQILLRELKRAKMPFREGEIFPRDTPRMTEAFLCSSVRGPVPIVRIEKQKIGTGKPGPVFAKLRSLYIQACVRETGITNYELRIKRLDIGYLLFVAICMDPTIRRSSSISASSECSSLVVRYPVALSNLIQYEDSLASL
jgi:branched-chain amino acid aminotransferase